MVYVSINFSYPNYCFLGTFTHSYWSKKNKEFREVRYSGEWRHGHLYGKVKLWIKNDKNIRLIKKIIGKNREVLESKFVPNHKHRSNHQPLDVGKTLRIMPERKKPSRFLPVKYDKFIWQDIVTLVISVIFYNSFALLKLFIN